MNAKELPAMTVTLVPLPEDAKEAYERGLQEAGVLPDAIATLAKHGLFIIPLVRDRHRHDTVDRNVYSQALFWYHQSLAEIAALRAKIRELEPVALAPAPQPATPADDVTAEATTAPAA